MSRLWCVRAAVLFLAGELLVHQVRYAVAPPELVREFAPAHRYLWWLIPLVGALLFLAAAQWGLRLRAPERDTLPRLPRLSVLWAGLVGCLLAAFVLQECAESLVFRGQMLTLDELAGGNGGLVVPLAVAVGGIIALTLGGAVRALRWARSRAAGSSAPTPAAPAVRPVVLALVPRASVLARQLAGRAPPHAA